MITRAAVTRWVNDVDIVDWAEAGLPAPSYVRWKLFTLENAIFVKAVDQLAAADVKQCRVALKQLLG